MAISLCISKESEKIELTEIPDIEYYIDVLGYELESTYDLYV